MEQAMAESIQTRRFSMILLSAFAALALALAAVGIYGVMSYSVAQRLHEVGIRMALGAQAVDVMRLIFKGALMWSAFGIVIGALGAFGLTRLMNNLFLMLRPQMSPRLLPSVQR